MFILIVRRNPQASDRRWEEFEFGASDLTTSRTEDHFYGCVSQHASHVSYRGRTSSITNAATRAEIDV